MPFFVYVLQNPQGRYYIGQTSNLETRLQQHNHGKVTWTKSRGPWRLVYHEAHDTRSEAMRAERQLKNLKSRLALVCSA